MNSTSAEVVIRQFDWIEYAVFSMMFGISILIGVYFGFYKGGQKTVADYLLGNRQMSVFPITMSLISSFVSGITILGIPSEVYTYGPQYACTIFTILAIYAMTLFIFLPVFYNLHLISLYEYLELRFNHKVRVMVSLLFTIGMLLYIPIVIYGPALALNQVSGMHIHVVTPIICIICIFYTTIGGLKAVVWADTIQGIIMLGAVFVVVALGTIKVGGTSAVLQAASEGNRMDVFNMDPDPKLRLTFWSSAFGMIVPWSTGISVGPAAYQRFNSLPSLKQAKVALFWLTVGIYMLLVPSLFLGLVIYAMYKDCDPLSSKAISRPDQIVPYFVLDVTENIKGLPAIFVVGVCSAALSTMSTGLNTMAGTIYEDFIEPCLKKKLSDEKASSILKILAVIIGAVCVSLVFMVEKLGAIIQISNSFGGVTAGAILGIFTLGVLIPPANAKGALVGGIAGLCATSFMIVGSQLSLTKELIKYPMKTVSTMGCTGNVTRLIINETEIIFEEGVWPIHRISLFNLGLVGFAIVLIVGITVSYITGPTTLGLLNPDLVSPLVHCFLPKKDYKPVQLKDVSINGNNVKK